MQEIGQRLIEAAHEEIRAAAHNPERWVVFQERDGLNGNAQNGQRLRCIGVGEIEPRQLQPRGRLGFFRRIGDLRLETAALYPELIYRRVVAF